ncbi:MAG: hypothetical protein M0C28_30230 [Candidatus Moduliflexus flocculans]|nr:hypothetical protein [Candidatus Moduliflexus flocculans]
MILVKEGRILEDGPKADVLSSKLISELFDIPVAVRKEDGSYRAVPS